MDLPAVPPAAVPTSAPEARSALAERSGRGSAALARSVSERVLQIYVRPRGEKRKRAEVLQELERKRRRKKRWERNFKPEWVVHFGA